MVGCQEDNRLVDNPIQLIPAGSLLELEEELPKGNWLTKVHLVKWSLDGTSSSIENYYYQCQQ